MHHLIHGAKWWKFDFHNHTPASNDFGKGNAAHMAITAENWLLMYMNAGIDCVAITDHNSGGWIDILKSALASLEVSQPAGYRKLYLFPGVEISASGNTHILGLFDPTADTAEIQTLLGAVGFPAQHIGTTNDVASDTVENVIKKVHDAGGIAIPAHADKESGLLSLTGATLIRAIGAEGLLAIEVIDRAFVKPELYRQSKLQLTEVVGTDSHIAAQVGTNYTWVKMGEPSLDALKLALHDRDDGVIRKDETLVDPNTISNRYFIKSLAITKGYRAGNGKPLKAEFSPWLTSIIGGRGSGKSTLVNYLRIAMARVDEMPDEVQSEFDKFSQLGRKNGSGMLRNDTEIEAEIFKDSKLHLIRWTNSTNTLQEWNNTSNKWDAGAAVSKIKDLFPIQIFSQKELYALTGNPSKLIELIDSQFDKAAWTEAKEELVSRWIAARAKSRQLRNSISEEANLKAQINSANNKIGLIESSEYNETLSKFNTLTASNKFFSSTSESVSNFIHQIEQLELMAPKLGVPEELKDVVIDESLQFVQGINSAMEVSKIKIKEAIAALLPYKENLQEKVNSLPWFKQYEDAKKAYEAIAEKLQELGTETYETLIQKRAVLTDRVALIEAQKTELKSLDSTLNTLYETIIEKEKELRTTRNGVISRWKELDDATNPFLIIELSPMADTESANDAFRQLIRKPGGEFSDYILGTNDVQEADHGIIADIVNEPIATRWEKRRTAIAEFLSATEADKKNLDLRLAKHIDYLKQNTPEDIDRLLVWVPDDKLVLKFRKQGKEEDIETGSAGERTAGMLGLLLVLNDIPLIIDQPEDDLDTSLISRFVVEGFKKLKQKRQLIIVTHNPNITVNANSDNVIHMDFVSGQVIMARSNALQDKQIRTAVCEVMEGGRDALDKRYFRISKALKS